MKRKFNLIDMTEAFIIGFTFAVGICYLVTKWS